MDELGKGGNTARSVSKGVGRLQIAECLNGAPSLQGSCTTFRVGERLTDVSTRAR